MNTNYTHERANDNGLTMPALNPPRHGTSSGGDCVSTVPRVFLWWWERSIRGLE